MSFHYTYHACTLSTCQEDMIENVGLSNAIRPKPTIVQVGSKQARLFWRRREGVEQRNTSWTTRVVIGQNLEIRLRRHTSASSEVLQPTAQPNLPGFASLFVEYPGPGQFVYHTTTTRLFRNLQDVANIFAWPPALKYEELHPSGCERM